jgi:hypothetical protein
MEQRDRFERLGWLGSRFKGGNLSVIRLNIGGGWLYRGATQMAKFRSFPPLHGSAAGADHWHMPAFLSVRKTPGVNGYHHCDD